MQAGARGHVTTRWRTCQRCVPLQAGARAPSTRAQQAHPERHAAQQKRRPRDDGAAVDVGAAQRVAARALASAARVRVHPAEAVVEAVAAAVARLKHGAPGARAAHPVSVARSTPRGASAHRTMRPLLFTGSSPRRACVALLEKSGSRGWMRALETLGAAEDVVDGVVVLYRSTTRRRRRVTCWDVTCCCPPLALRVLSACWRAFTSCVCCCIHVRQGRARQLLWMPREALLQAAPVRDRVARHRHVRTCAPPPRCAAPRLHAVHDSSCSTRRGLLLLPAFCLAATVAPAPCSAAGGAAPVQSYNLEEARRRGEARREAREETEQPGTLVELPSGVRVRPASSNGTFANQLTRLALLLPRASPALRGAVP